MADFGSTSLQVALLNMPYGIFQAGFGLLAGYVVHKIPNSRLIVMAVSQIPPIIGTVLINQLPTTNSWGRLAGIWLISSFSVRYQINLGLMASNIVGSTKMTFASGLIFVVYCAGQISGEFMKWIEHIERAKKTRTSNFQDCRKASVSSWSHRHALCIRLTFDSWTCAPYRLCF
jgi:hypothetical protein